jgi:hypothetical protein
MQASLGVLATVLEIFFLPETSDNVLYHGMSNLGLRAKAGKVWSRLNPVNVFVLMRYPNLLAAVCSIQVSDDRLNSLTN